MTFTRLRFSFVFLVCFGLPIEQAEAVELVRLSAENWDAFVPTGKEVDAIYGDWVLRNEEIIVVIADAIGGRTTNMTTAGVGGCVIDLTLRRKPNDQLNVYYPAAGRALRLREILADGKILFAADDSGEVTNKVDEPIAAQEFVFVLDAVAKKGKAKVQVEYRFAKGDKSLRVETTYSNPTDQSIKIAANDKLRADGEFEFGSDETHNLLWAYDSFWGQAYGILAERGKLHADPERMKKSPPKFGYQWGYGLEEAPSAQMPPGVSGSLVRHLFPVQNLLDLRRFVGIRANDSIVAANIKIVDPNGPIAEARVDVIIDEQNYGSGRTSADGELLISAPAKGSCLLRITPPGRQTVEHSLDILSIVKTGKTIELPAPGMIVAKITSESGAPIPCKVGFYGKDGTPNPNFGPDSAIRGVRNLWYTHTGDFRLAIEPGSYEVFISYGPEFDAVIRQIEIGSGEEVQLTAKLLRTVDTTGWLSAELHSHSSPSGDNTASQRGRVLNLLAEHLEFIPCTEHNRITTYDPHLEYFGATKSVLTCPGMELTGRLLSINHQNAFPLLHFPHTQDGGGPLTDYDPEVQIERLAMWDNGSDKLVQTNHPNLVQMYGDRDMDGKPDSGFRKMFGFMDVVEIHPLEKIFTPPLALTTTSNDRGNAVFHWMQLLNLGYRITGVVNTDAHYNFHGSGPLRNYIKSTTDNPAEARVLDLCHAAEQGTLVMTNGPFMEVSASNPGSDGEPVSVGSDLKSEGDVSLQIRVQCANWLDVNRVQVFVNGRPEEKLNFTRRTHPKMFADGVQKFNESIQVHLKADAHLIVVAAGEGLQLGRVMGPVAGKTIPVTVSNPIFVDVDGDGFQANGGMLGLPLPMEKGK
ncbi:MAG: CehA/McbA family metallohydrolase [Planctomycetes bacterium]|nr:CehA/McbA family metallohydrolase [Planctomycetota bacterium]